MPDPVSDQTAPGSTVNVRTVRSKPPAVSSVPCHDTNRDMTSRHARPDRLPRLQSAITALKFRHPLLKRHRRAPAERHRHPAGTQTASAAVGTRA